MAEGQFANELVARATPPIGVDDICAYCVTYLSSSALLLLLTQRRPPMQ